MGRVLKRTVLRRGDRATLTNAKVDSGADVTLLSLKDARNLGFDPCVGKMAAVGTAGGRLMGLKFRVDVAIDDRKASVTAIVPMFRLVGKKAVHAQRSESLIGHDFLQASKAKLDYSKPHEEVFSGIDDPEWGPATKAEAALLDKKLHCKRKK